MNMLTQKKFILFGALFLVLQAGIAQKVETGTNNQTIKGTDTPGYYTEVEGTQEEVNASLSKFLKSYGKLKFASNPITVTEYVLSGKQYTTPMYGMTLERNGKIMAWIGILPTEWTESEQAKAVDKELSRLIYEFGVKFYRDKIQVNVDESVRAQQAVERQQQRMATESKNLQIKLENNQKEKIQLEKSLDVNKLEYLNLLMKIEQNKKSQDSLATAVEQVKKVVEMHKERQRKVN
jgi:hypothetical protein